MINTMQYVKKLDQLHYISEYYGININKLLYLLVLSSEA